MKSQENVIKARDLYVNGKSKRAIAKLFGVSKKTIDRWFDDSADARKLRNRRRQEARNRKYATDPLYQIKQRLKVANQKAKKHGYSACSTSPEEILIAKTDTCQCCKRNESECGGLCIDHWHDPPGEFRTWLCHDCNRALGLFQDNPTIVRQALRLLEGRKDA